MRHMQFQSGQSLIEVLLAVAIFAFLMTTVVVSFIDVYNGGLFSNNRTDGYRMAEEGIEAVRSIRDRDFDSLSSGVHGLSLSGGQWTFSGASDTQDIFMRVIEIGEPDMNTRSVTSTVFWTDGGQTRSVVLVTTLTDWQQHFLAKLDWPNAVVASTINLPGGADALAVAAVGTTAYIGRESSGDPEFYIVDASNALYPVTLGTLNLADDILGIAVTGTYAYLASKANSAELMVVNISNPTAPSLTTSLDLINNGDARRLAIKGNRLYLIRDNKGSNPTFYVFDISTPSSPVSLGSVFIGGGLDVATSKVGTEYAYIASETDTQELQAVNVTTPASMLVNGSADLISNNDAYAIAVSGTYAYVGTEDRGGDPEFFVMDISTPTSPSVVNTLNTEELFSVRAANGYVYLGGKANPPEIRIVDATNPLSLTTVASFDTSGNILDMAVTYNRLFAVSKGEPELVIIVPPKF